MTLLAACCSLLAARAAAAGRDELVVSIARGMAVRGAYLAGQRAFRGVPYAASPATPDRRFAPPQEAARWSGVRDALDWGPSCLQLGCPGVSGYGPAWPSINVSSCSEDCLTLNIFSPPAASRLPVMVYFHAGEFHFGSSHDQESNIGYGFQNSVVLVTVNSRIGVLGFAALEALRSRDAANSTGNYGMQDQRLALRWVRRHIAAFGGDPRSVTIFGESSGGSSVMYHLTNPRSGGLFQRVITESGGPTQTKPLDQAAVNTRWVAAMLTHGLRDPACPSPAAPYWRMFAGRRMRAEARDTVLDNVTLARAQGACWGSVGCTGVEWTAGTGDLGHAVLRQRTSMEYVATVNQSSQVDLWVKWVDESDGDAASAGCLLAADPSAASNVSTSGLPYDDVFLRDLWGPVIDGAELSATITELIDRGAVAPGVSALMGSNLDEGTEFMSEAPQISCNATEGDFAQWARQMFGAELGELVVPAYAPESLRPPLPDCEARYDPRTHKQTVVPASVWRSAAMRSAGDYAIGCRALQALRATAAAGGSAWRYLFSLTPTYSVNWRVPLSTVGAFHGAEVPFVFGAQFELKTDGERRVSEAMGCYWANFAATGDPNRGPSQCAARLRLPQWPPLASNASIEFTSNATIATDYGLQQEQCRVFAQFP